MNVMKKILLVALISCSLIISGCLEIEQGVTLNANGSGNLELKTDMSQLMSMLKMMDAGKGEKIKKDTIITYKIYLDTTTNPKLSKEEKALLYSSKWHLKLDSDAEVFTMTFLSPFNKPEDVSKIMNAIDKIDDVNIMKEAFKDMAPDDAGAGTGGMDDMGMGGGDKSFGDLTKRYFITDWKNGKLIKKLDTLAYKKINEDEGLASFKKMGEMAPGGEDMLENITVTAKFVLPRPAKKAEGKALKMSDDKKTITITTVVADIYEKPKNFEYHIEY
jgi:hypothetical protein